MKRMIGVLLAGALAAAIWMVAVPPGGPRSARIFDPDRVADLELEMWRAYYQRQHARLFQLLVTLLHDQLHFSWGRASEAAGYFAKAASRFAELHGGYEAVLPSLERGYELEKRWSGAHFDVEKVAKAELAWWAARRDAGTRSRENVGRLIGEMYAQFYEVPFADVAEAGRLRAEAATVRDRTAKEPDWETISTLLHRSYRSLHSACNE